MQQTISRAALALSVALPLGAVIAGCDALLGPVVPGVPISNLVVSDLAVGAVAPIVEIEDTAGRSYFRSDVTPDSGLGSFVIALPDRDLFIVLLDRLPTGGIAFLGVSDSFQAGQLTGDVTLDIRTQGGVVVGRATLDLP